MISISLFYCYKKVFTHINIWMIGKNSLKHLYQKKYFHSYLNTESIIDAGYMHAKYDFKDFEIKSLCEYHDSHVERNTLVIADVFEDYQNMCLKIYELGLSQFLTAARLA